MAIKKTTVVRTAVAAGIAGVGLSVGGVALANADQTPAQPNASQSENADLGGPDGGHGGPGEHGRPGGHGMGSDQLAATLATELGIDQSKVETALENLHDSMGPGSAGQPGESDQAPDATDRMDAFATALADELGVTKAQVSAALAKVEAAENAEHRSELASRLDEAVSAGDLTAADKQSVLKAFDAGVLGGPH